MSLRQPNWFRQTLLHLVANQSLIGETVRTRKTSLLLLVAFFFEKQESCTDFVAVKSCASINNKSPCSAFAFNFNDGCLEQPWFDKWHLFVQEKQARTAMILALTVQNQNDALRCNNGQRCAVVHTHDIWERMSFVRWVVMESTAMKCNKKWETAANHKQTQCRNDVRSIFLLWTPCCRSRARLNAMGLVATDRVRD